MFSLSPQSSSINQSVTHSVNQLVSIGTPNVYIGESMVDISVSSGFYAIFHQPSFARLALGSCEPVLDSDKAEPLTMYI
jgi:hypothetical protein